MSRHVLLVVIWFSVSRGLPSVHRVWGIAKHLEIRQSTQNFLENLHFCHCNILNYEFILSLCGCGVLVIDLIVRIIC